MITDPPINNLLDNVDCRYTLVIQVSKRARQLVAGAQSLINSEEVKPVSLAVQEIDAGYVEVRPRHEDIE